MIIDTKTVNKRKFHLNKHCYSNLLVVIELALVCFEFFFFVLNLVSKSTRISYYLNLELL